MVDGIRIDELPPELSPTFTAVFPFMDGGVTRYMSVDQVADLILGLIVDGAPESLDTLNELAAALADDANFAATVVASLAEKAPINSPTFTGNPTAPTQPPGNNSTRLATTAFVTAMFTALGTRAAIYLGALGGFTAKATPADADSFGYQQDSDGTGRKFTWANLKAALASVFMGVNGNGSVATTTLSPSIVVTGIASDTKEIVVDFAGLQCAASGAQVYFRFGVGGSLVATGYAGSGSRIAAGAAATLNATIGMLIYLNTTAEIASGKIVASLVDSATNLWQVTMTGGCGQTVTFISSTFIALSGPPDQVALITSTGNLVAGAKINTRQRK